jgi:hypothetical protein
MHPDAYLVRALRERSARWRLAVAGESPPKCPPVTGAVETPGRAIVADARRSHTEGAVDAGSLPPRRGDAPSSIRERRGGDAGRDLPHRLATPRHRARRRVEVGTAHGPPMHRGAAVQPAWLAASSSGRSSVRTNGAVATLPFWQPVSIVNSWVISNTRRTGRETSTRRKLSPSSQRCR